MNHNHQDRGVYHPDCSGCRFLSKLMAEAGFAQPNQAAHGTGEQISPPVLDPPSTEHLRIHLSRDHNLPLDLSRPVLVRVHQACHRRNHFHQGHYLTNYAPLHTDCVILTTGNPETFEAVREQLGVDRPRPGGRVLSPRDQTHRDARLRQVSEHGDRESVLHSQRVTAAIGKAKAGLDALQETNARRAEMIRPTIARIDQMHQAKGLELHYGFDKPYTYAIAQLVDDTGVKPYLGLGTARCSDDDPWDHSMGCQLAVGRALEDIGKQMIIGAGYVDELRNARRGRV